MNIISRKVEELLHTYGDMYLKNFDEKAVTKDLFAGSLTLKDVELKPEAFVEKSLPFKLISGKIQEVVLKIPWKNIFNEAVIIRISGANIQLETKTLEDVHLSFEEEYRSKLKDLTVFFKAEYSKQMGSSSSVLNFWVIKNLIDRVIDNVQISFKNMHMQVDHKVVEHPFSIEVSLRELDLHTTDSSFINKLYVKQAKEVEGSTKKQIFKLLNLNSFHMDIKPYSNQAEKNFLFYENMDKYSIFKFSFQVRLIKNAEHAENDPDYEASVKFNQNEVSLTYWQIQRILNLLDYMKKLKERFDSIRASFKYHPERRIAEFFRIDPGKNPDVISRYERLKAVAIANWWQFAILEVVKSRKKYMKKHNKGKFYNFVASMNIDKLMDYDIPSVMTEAYEGSFNNYLESMVKVNFDVDKMIDNDLSMHKLQSLLFLIPVKVQRVLASRFARDYSAKVRERQRNTWVNYALSFIPFLGDPGLTSDQKEFKDMLEGEFGKEKRK